MDADDVRLAIATSATYHRYVIHNLKKNKNKQSIWEEVMLNLIDGSQLERIAGHFRFSENILRSSIE